MEQESRFACDMIYSRQFYDTCLASHISPNEMNQISLCNSALKQQTITVSLDAMRAALLEALAYIGAFSNSHPFFEPHLNRAWQRPTRLPTFEEWVEGRPPEAIEEFARSGYMDSFS